MSGEVIDMGRRKRAGSGKPPRQDFKHGPKQRKTWREDKARQRARDDQADMFTDAAADSVRAAAEDSVRRDVRGVPADNVLAPVADSVQDKPRDSVRKSRADKAKDVSPAPVPQDVPAVSRQVSPVPSVEDSTVPSAEPAPSLGGGIEQAVGKAFILACMLGAAVCNFVLQQWTMQSLFAGKLGPVDCGSAAAAGLILLEIGVGHRLGELKGRPGERGAAWLLVVVMVGIAASEAMLPMIRETQAHKQAVHDAAREVPPAQEECKERDAPKEYGMQRLPIWLESERKRVAECNARRVTAQQEHQKKLVQADDEHSAWETPFRVLFGMVLSLGIVALASAVGDFVHALRVICERLLAIPAGIVGALFKRRAPVAPTAPVTAPAPPAGGLPVRVPVAVPAAHEPFWTRLARWPLARMFVRQRQPVGAA
jgi:hypothetical protein